MPIALTDRIVALLTSLTNEQVEELPPVERRRLEDQCLRVAVLCAPIAKMPCSGVLGALGTGPTAGRANGQAVSRIEPVTTRGAVTLGFRSLRRL
jgi:hypothetical protein